MALILHIDTSTDTASLCMAKDAQVIACKINPGKKDHAGWLHPALQQTMKETGIELQQLDALAISIGPGSYTGLRIGLAAAKGICYALNKPLVAIDTLTMWSVAASEEAEELICPMIDARRMEVFTALLDKDYNFIEHPQALILNENSFSGQLASHKILFTGNGSRKFRSVCTHANAEFSSVQADASHLRLPAEKKFEKKAFADLAYLEPLYLKEFFSACR